MASECAALSGGIDLHPSLKVTQDAATIVRLLGGIRLRSPQQAFIAGQVQGVDDALHDPVAADHLGLRHEVALQRLEHGDCTAEDRVGPLEIDHQQAVRAILG